MKKIENTKRNFKKDSENEKKFVPPKINNRVLKIETKEEINIKLIKITKLLLTGNKVLNEYFPLGWNLDKCKQEIQNRNILNKILSGEHNDKEVCGVSADISEINKKNPDELGLIIILTEQGLKRFGNSAKSKNIANAELIKTPFGTAAIFPQGGFIPLGANNIAFTERLYTKEDRRTGAAETRGKNMVYPVTSDFIGALNRDGEVWFNYENNFFEFEKFPQIKYTKTETPIHLDEIK